MPIPYHKPALSISDQLAKLVGRRMAIPDPASAAKVLERISYYRLSAYELQWRQAGTNVFRPGIVFDEVVALYDFDQALRCLILEAIEPIEIAFRTRITLHLAMTYGSFAHTDPRHFRPSRHPWDHRAWLAKLDEEADRSHEVFIDHFKQKYMGFPRLPLWMATEIMSMGSLSKLYSAMLMKDQRVIARALGQNEVWLPSWFHCLSVLRNSCAHHGRLWDRHQGVKPALPQQAVWRPLSLPHNNNRIGCMIFVIYRLLVAIDRPTRIAWRTRMRIHLAPMLPRWGTAMGLPADWFSSPLWND